MSTFKAKNLVATVITVAVGVVAAAFVALLLDIRIPILSNITDMLGLTSP